jgi:hypothetical protein
MLLPLAKEFPEVVPKDIYKKFNFHPTRYSFVDYAGTIRKYAVGYIHGSRLFCRPRENEVAIMFLVDDVFGWTHFREEEFEEVRASLEDIKQENIDALDEEILRTKQFAARFRQQIEDKKAIFQSWMHTLNASEVALFAVLRIFRAENSRYRKDALRPVYFDTLPTLRQVSIQKPDMSQQEQMLTHLQEKIKLLEDSLPSRREKIHHLFDRHIQQLNFIQKDPVGLRKEKS